MLSFALRSAEIPFAADWVILGVVAQLLAGLFLGSAVGKGRPRDRLMEMLGSTPSNLGFLRDAIQARARGQAGAALFALGSLLILAGMLFPSPGEWRIQAAGSVVLIGLAFSFLSFLDRYVERALRRYLRDHLHQHSFPFEDHIALTREIGELFGVTSTPEDTWEAYVARVRLALGIDRPSAGMNRGTVPRPMSR